MVKQIFTLDEAAVKTLSDSDFNLTVKPKGKPEYTLGAGTQFAIVSRDNIEVRATMIDAESGKPKRGRPRRFPVVLVARLLGEDGLNKTPDASAAVVAGSVVSQAAGFVDEADDLSEEEVISDEERAENEARVAALFGDTIGDNSTDSDW